MGNYKGFGDCKFVPALPMERLELLILASEAAAQGPSIPALWQQVIQGRGCCTGTQHSCPLAAGNTGERHYAQGPSTVDKLC